MRIGLIGKKLGMSRIFHENGDVIPVTIIEVKDNYVIGIKKEIEKDNYSAIQIGCQEVEDKKLRKSELGKLKKNNLPSLKVIKELRMKNDDEVNDFKIGQKLNVEIFKKGDLVDITGKTIGKGFQGVVKRHGFKGGPATHGSMSHRKPGSIGGTTPARVLKGQRMAGHMGNEKQTIQNLEVVQIMPDKNLILIKGAVPGPKNRYLLIRKAIKGLGK